MTPFRSVIARTLLRPLVMSLQLFAGYVVVHGHYSPGGGFQAGALLACAMILPVLVLGAGEANRKDAQTEGRWLSPSPRLAMAMGGAGVLLYAVIGLVPLLMGAEFLNYGMLPIPGVGEAQRRSLGILGIELGVTLGVAGSVVAIFHALYGPSHHHRSKRTEEGEDHDD